MTAPTGQAPVGAKPGKDDKRKQTIIVVASVMGVLLTYLIYRRSKSTAAQGGTTTAASPTSDTAIGDLAASEGNTQTLLGQLGNQISGLTAALTPSTTDTAPVAAPAPIASTLFAPSADAVGYERLNNGFIGQVESDGSILGLTGQQWLGIQAANPGLTPTDTGTDTLGAPDYWTSSNIASAPVNQTTTPIHAAQSVP